MRNVEMKRERERKRERMRMSKKCIEIEDVARICFIVVVVEVSSFSLILIYILRGVLFYDDENYIGKICV